MPKNFFVMLNYQHGGATPMMDDYDEVVFYESEAAARVDADRNPLGEHFGYEVFELGTGA